MNQIHPSAVIGPDVSMGSNNSIGPYCVIYGKVTIGDDNWIGPNVVIGTPGEMRGVRHFVPWADEQSADEVRIGSGNVIREFTAIQQGAQNPTTIGDDCYIMDKAHIAHDLRVGSGVTIACGVMFAGHVIVGDGANIGLGAVVHQRLAIGQGAMVGMGSVVTRDVPPYVLSYGSPARFHGANRVGLERHGVESSTIEKVASAAEPDYLRELEMAMPEVAAQFAGDVRTLLH
jgi:UDP-N-acetylglucosamine acyltransferase